MDKDIIDDLIDLTDTEEDSTSSSSHQVFEGRQPFVLELHELQKDPANPQEADKKKKKKRKNKLPSNRSNSGESTSSPSESSIPPTVTDAAKEQFFDAHESFHGLQETKPTAALTLGQSHSEHTPSPKIMDALPPPAPTTQPSSAVSKQVPRPPE